MKQHGKKIFVVGSFIVGITMRVSRLPAPGETIVSDLFDIGPGGKGFNQGVAAKRAGANVHLIICIGKDVFGSMAEAAFREEQIGDHLLIRVADEATGCGTVTLLPSGENSIIINTGANNKLSANMISDAAKYIAESKIVMAQLEVPDAVIEQAFRLAKKSGALTILNPAPARMLTPEIVKYTDIFTPNETEAKILLGLKPDADVPVTDIAQRLREMGFETVIMTRGKYGALIITKDEITEVAAPRITSKDPTGAGDCFNGNLAAALINKLSLKEAVWRAVYAGAFCAQQLGVIGGLPKKKELDDYIKVHQLISKTFRYE